MKHSSVEIYNKEGRLLVGASTGSSDDAEERGRALLKAGADAVSYTHLFGGFSSCFFKKGQVADDVGGFQVRHTVLMIAEEFTGAS